MSEKNNQNLKYGHLTTKEAEDIPCYILSVDLIGLYKIGSEGNEDPSY